MKLIVDECLAKSSILVLEKLGIEILTIIDILNFGSEDEKIYEYASLNQIPLITHDRRFGQIYFESYLAPPLTIVLQIVFPYPKGTNELIKKFFLRIGNSFDLFKGKLVIISNKKIRIRSKN
ncbi:DUF5615 family PIN-like protein [Promethearchaeum syntrophicum]|uniref:DUF5615 family PIN-like protein n=1 Tax=Promethearchaeum syntrophicum TaxID=2594042 RepID=A0A5B9DCV9_9ARCH|nr:DUF5615 family PIN-like protein [Candidatus Prometheoarchaeum syntrophicum]QEE16600.1 hypothetical protein DSAG12_02430 [Candidatus Prometheoarchaeum syntrophicum]